MMAPFVEEHVGVDHEGTIHSKSQIDLFGTAYQIPADDASFDSALCTAVLEHLEEPERAIRECWRVLRPGGVAVYSVPFIWHLHEEPRDFFRFSKHGLAYLFTKAGFEVVEIKPLAGFWVTFGQLFVYRLYLCKRRIVRMTGILPAAALLIQGLAAVLDKIDHRPQWTWMYMVVARKKDAALAGSVAAVPAGAAAVSA
jgi:SAM-dependent methyltransferase